MESKNTESMGKVENLKKEIQQNAVSALDIREGQWMGQGETHSGNYTVYYSGNERDVAIVVHKSTVRNAVKKIVFHELTKSQ